MEVAENDAVKVDGRSIVEQQGRKHSEAVGEGEVRAVMVVGRWGGGGGGGGRRGGEDAGDQAATRPPRVVEAAR